jgi:tetratricopeptide (TPR) repeat protein
MANLAIQKRFLGEGYVGTVDLKPALSWADQRALQGAAAGAMQSAVELRAIRGSLDDLAFGSERIAASIRDLEGELGFRLEEQSRLLEQEVSLLAQISETLRTPAKTRAAERLSDTGELLRRGRWDRALTLAEEAIADDPNNPAAFTAAGWALMGLERLPEAQRSFLESAEAADGDTRSRATRQAARLAFANSSSDEALRVLALADDRVSDFERRGLSYDKAIYMAASGQPDEAVGHLVLAITDDEAFCFYALSDPLVKEHVSLLMAAKEEISTLIGGLAEERAVIGDAISHIASCLMEAVTLASNLRKEAELETFQQKLATTEDAVRDITISSSQTLTDKLAALRQTSRSAAELNGSVDQWIDALRHENATAVKLSALLDEAIERLRREQKATVVTRSATRATLRRRRLGGLMDDMWEVWIRPNLEVPDGFEVVAQKG